MVFICFHNQNLLSLKQKLLLSNLAALETMHWLKKCFEYCCFENTRSALCWKLNGNFEFRSSQVQYESYVMRRRDSIKIQSLWLFAEYDGRKNRNGDKGSIQPSSSIQLVGVFSPIGFSACTMQTSFYVDTNSLDICLAASFQEDQPKICCTVACKTGFLFMCSCWNFYPAPDQGPRPI